MNSPFKKLQVGITALAIVFLLSVVAFHFVAGYEWIDALWIVVITISTVGYGEHSDVDNTTQLLSIVVILFGVTAGAYTFGGLIQIILQGELDRVLGRRRMESEIKRLNHHTIICGYGRLGQMLAQQLAALKYKFVLLENDPGRVELARTHGFLVIDADATEEDVLSQAGIDRARAIVIALPTDAENVFITLTARNMQPKIKIIAQAEHESSCKKLRQAGVNDVVLAHRMVAQHMARLIARPSTANLFALLAESSDLNYELDELTIPQDCKLVGKSMAELRIRERYHLLIVGIKRPDEVLDFNPEPSRAFGANETILLMGKAEDIDRFGKDHCLKA